MKFCIAVIGPMYKSNCPEMLISVFLKHIKQSLNVYFTTFVKGLKAAELHRFTCLSLFLLVDVLKHTCISFYSKF